MNDIATKQPRRMLEPTKDELRAHIATLEAEVAELSMPWWARVLRHILRWMSA